MLYNGYGRKTPEYKNENKEKVGRLINESAFVV